MLQLEDGIVDLLQKIVKDNGLEIDMQVIEKPRTMDEYVQASKSNLGAWIHKLL